MKPAAGIKLWKNAWASVAMAWSLILISSIAWQIRRIEGISKQQFSIYIINLKSRPDRLAGMLSRIRTTPPPQIIPAVDGRTLPASTTELTRGEIGCFKSHIEALSAFVNQSKPYGIILEDDAKLQLPESYGDIIAVMQDAPSDWGLLSLGCNYFPKKQRRARSIAKRLYKLNGSYLLGTHAILYTKQAASALLDEVFNAKFEFVLPWDLWLSRIHVPTKLYVVHPAIATPANFDPQNPFLDSATRSIK
jgi:GR25 family glycosyltransferase involved in LPS biosynthesis